MDTNFLEMWRSTGLIARVVVLALTGMTCFLAVAAVQAGRRWKALLAEVGRVEGLAETTDKAAASAARRQAIRLLCTLDLRVSTIGNLAWGAAVVGLFGTVTGLVNGLLWVTRSGHVDPARLSAGIVEALVTLVWGLLIAMAAGLGWSFFRSRSSQARLRTMLALE
jgi:biopolymer transport protein ExbB/TolQ